jgi:polyisoprenoid-binding protein YceI
MTDLVHRSPSQQRPVVARSRHWWRWAAGTVGGLLLIGVVAALVFLHFFIGPAAAPLTLPPPITTTAATAGSTIDGTWTVEKGSLAGYRVDESFLWQRDSVVGRTSAVTGQVVIADAEASSASFRVDLTTVKANGKTQPQFAGILGTASYRYATFTLTAPIVPVADPAVDKTFTTKATGLLSIHGVTRPVTVGLNVRYSGSVLEEAGSIPVVFSDWNIKAPGYPLQNHGVVEFLLVMQQ